jgi:hypothetical protein
VLVRERSWVGEGCEWDGLHLRKKKWNWCFLRETWCSVCEGLCLRKNKEKKGSVLMKGWGCIDWTRIEKKTTEKQVVKVLERKCGEWGGLRIEEK